MKIVIVGGTGLIGRALASILQNRGHEIVVASPSKGVDSVSGAGVKAALTGADVVVDVSNSPSFDEQAVLRFFQNSTQNLLSAAKDTGVAHYVALSIVGVDRIDNPYFRAKRLQEELIEKGGVPYTIVRATQFFEFLDAIAASATAEGDVLRVSSSRFQPIAASDVSAALAEFSVAGPRNGIVDIAGPDASSVAEFIQILLKAKGDPRKVVPDPAAGYFGAALDADGLAPTGTFLPGPTRFVDWFNAS